MKAEELKDLIIEKQDELIIHIEFCDSFGSGYYRRRNKIKHRLADLRAQLNKLNQDCIEKAAPNLSKIEDVDKELAEIKEKHNCKNCYYELITRQYNPCDICSDFDKWEPKTK